MAKSGVALHPLYSIWRGMRERCEKQTRRSYKNYGGRGIKVCERWRRSFRDFVADMGERPPGTTLDRIDNDGGYAPKNCRWATREEQRNNYRHTVYVVVDGERISTSQAARRFGVSGQSLHFKARRLGSYQAAADCYAKHGRKKPNLSEEQVVAILMDVSTGKGSYRQIGSAYGICPSRVCQLVKAAA